MAIRVRGLTVSLGGRDVLCGVDLDVAPSSCLAVLGPSGCGKSTLLRVLAGLVTPIRGALQLGDVELGPDTIGALRRRLGYVIQEGGLFPHLTARANVSLAARLAGWSPDRIASRLRELCDLCRLAEPLLDRYPVELSGGQRQRVGLARALFLAPELILLDEPFGALDPVVRAELQDELRDLLATGATTTVLVTHDVAEAGLLGDRIALLREGKVEQMGTLRDLVEAPANDFVRTFVAAHRSVRDLLEGKP